MPRPTKVVEGSTRRRPPAITPQDREDQLYGLAYDLAEKQMMAGTASSQVITHFLQRGSTREKLEVEKLRNENELLRKKAESLQSLKNIEELYRDAIKAMRVYGGQSGGEEEYEV